MTPLSGIHVGSAGTPLAQAKGPEIERAGRQLDARQRRVYYEGEAEAASGVGQPDGEDHEASQRDADGRRPWEEPPESGNLLDLDG